ncbi:hypothetical protein P175DRAFT_0330762 [Aspergillus ochraceoroseus IBT 24754]|uniref:Uncharacterized protein n=1 Tax=Aspergillus ochraceoroseus IBT 24754 TaxID=1392256 RepID=A0A2T5LR41_9EURO|nr:uncharacterized protein P175DRAFT_0330762 [Aspergillus ochraceoroseus IBT 24754]PTU18755.1 hypothetical protein P175DRAFT_0330762 [Aspergillus ochraceoroseus IBT 24754]
MVRCFVVYDLAGSVPRVAGWRLIFLYSWTRYRVIWSLGSLFTHTHFPFFSFLYWVLDTCNTVVSKGGYLTREL